MPTFAERKDPHTGLLLARVRKAKGISQSDLAERFGVTLVDVRMWELGREPIPADLRPSLAEFFGLDPMLLDRPTRLEISVQERTLLQRYHRASRDTGGAVRRILMMSDEQEVAGC